MKKILNITLASLLVCLLGAGCIKDAEQASYLTSDQAKPHMDALAAGIPLSMIRIGSVDGYPWDFGYPGLMIIRDMMTGDVDHLGNQGYDWMQNFSTNFGPWLYTSYAPSLFWTNYWFWVKGCNDVIRYTRENEDADLSNLGVAYAYRAFFYLDMVRLFGYKPSKYIREVPEGLVEGLAIPIVTEDTTEREAANNPRVMADEVYELILSDLAQAEELMADYHRPNVMMPNLPVVYGLLARTFLELGDASVTYGGREATGYTFAAEYARKAINASGCTPLSQAQWEDPITGFNSSTANNSWMWALTQNSDQVSNLMNFTAWMAHEQSFGYGQIGGAAFGVPADFYTRIEWSDFRKHSWIDPDGYRFYHYNIAWPNLTEYFEKQSPYTSLKFRVGGGDQNNPTIGAATDVPLMRVEEMYFIEAEAVAHESLAEGRQLLTDFMQRYRITDGEYSTAGIISVDDLVEELIFQKRVEFWGEGIVLFDLKRLSLGCTETAYYKYSYSDIAPYWNLCIPLSEIQNNPGIQVNNPNAYAVPGE